MNNWQIALSSWIIQDGNYLDFKIDQQVEFALEFAITDNAIINSDNQKSVNIMKDCKYKVTAEVIHINDQGWFIDFGLRAYNAGPIMKGIKVGNSISATIWLGIDYFSYFESFGIDKKVPELIYTWRINKILIQTAPYIEQIYEGPGFMNEKKIKTRDPLKLGYREIAMTDAWRDDAGSAEYILNCENLQCDPKRTLERQE
jgi:hypothetical protein